MKASRILKKSPRRTRVCGFGAHANLCAQVEVFLEGGSASQSVIYDRATNFFAGGTLTVKGGRLLSHRAIFRH
jgi:hypothetical protein